VRYSFTFMFGALERLRGVSLTTWMLLAAGGGAVLGWLAPDFALRLELLSNIFLRLIRSIIAPVLFGVLVRAVGGAGALRVLGRIGDPQATRLLSRWAEGRDPPDVTRMIWNGWKSDRCVADLATDALLGRWCAELAGWEGTRLNQEGCLWKPPGAEGLAFHQDASYNRWIEPVELVTAWVPLDPVGPESGGIEYVTGSHTWGPGPKPRDFHRPEDYRAAAREAARARGREAEFARPEVEVGGVVFHHHWVFHGSGPTTSGRDRRVVALHTMAARARFHPENPAYAQGRYRRFGSTEMAESFYPVLWRRDGYRSAFLEEYLAGEGIRYRSHVFGERRGGS